ncbi:hypothetical protein MPER_08123 [Moniliophthora perniciosa FA553]|nr:hypothetical protein MPER_08123 [Moniliophthora perniciosa FA553]
MTKWDVLPNVIAIDGLDECIDHVSQERLLTLIRKVVHARYPIPWTFLIFSRPELQIQDAFGHEDFNSSILEWFAIRPSEEANRDIRQCLVDRFAELRVKLRALRHEDESWPGEDAIEQLIERADGQFIFDCLNAVLRIRVVVGSKSPYSELDLLYQHIMSTCLEKWEKVQPVLRLLVTPYPDDLDDLDINMRSPAMIERLLTLKKGEVATLLSTLHSVLQIPEDDVSDIYIMHASFSEFLSDVNRSANYHSPPLRETRVL